jgi:hypothetical protein
MKTRIEEIIYETTREIYNIEDKLRIATLFLFCERVGSEKLSELLYCENHINFVNSLNSEYKDYDVDFTINFENPNVKSAFYKTLDAIVINWDSNGFLKALYNKDEYAIVICDILNYNFSQVQIKQITKQIAVQLSLF